MLPPEREVECPCAMPLQRPVGFDPRGWPWRVTACVRCGVVTVVEQIISEPRPHDTRCVGNRPLVLDPSVLAWLASWPRVAGRDSDWSAPVFLSASVKARREGALAVIEADERTAQTNLSRKERFFRAGVPSEPAPGPMISQLKHFMQVWEGLRLTETTPYEELLSHVGTHGFPFALPYLQQRPTFEADVAELLSSSDVVRRRIGADLAGHLDLATPAILDAIEKWLDERALDARDLHSALNLIAGLAQRAVKLAIPLERLAARIGDSDYFLKERVTDLVAQVKAPKTSPEASSRRKRRR